MEPSKRSVPSSSPSSLAVSVSIAPSGPNCVASSSVVASGTKSQPLTVPLPGVQAMQLRPGNLQNALQTLTRNQNQRKESQQPVQVAKTAKVFNVNVKLINPDKKSHFETYVLRGVGPQNVTSSIHLKQQIFEQLGCKLVSSKLDFPVGYNKLGSKLWIRSDADIKDVWSFMDRGESVSFWCHALHAVQSPNSEDDNTDDDFPIRKPKRKKRKKSTAI